MNLTEHTALSIRLEMQQKGWIERTELNDTSHDWAETQYWRRLHSNQTGGMTQLRFHPYLVGDDDGTFVDNGVCVSCFVKPDGGLTRWSLLDNWAETAATFFAHKTTLDDLSELLTAWLSLFELD